MQRQVTDTEVSDTGRYLIQDGTWYKTECTLKNTSGSATPGRIKLAEKNDRFFQIKLPGMVDTQNEPLGMLKKQFVDKSLSRDDYMYGIREYEDFYLLKFFLLLISLNFFNLR